MNKPAASIYLDKQIHFYFWPLKLPKKTIEKYTECGVNIKCRNLESIDTKHTDNTQLVLIHTIRSTELANLIISDIDEFISKHISDDDYDLYVCSEGLSFSSKGDATLNLATYKGVLLSKIYEHYSDNLKRLFTYSPNTLKSVAGCATAEYRSKKENMIKSFMREPLNSQFKDKLIDGTLVAQTNFITGVDDIVDSYWALKTMIKKEFDYPQ